MKRTKATSLADALWPRARQRVLGALLADPEQELHLRELARRVAMAPATVQREASLLADAGVLERRVRGRQVFYRAAVSCPIYPELRSIVIKTVGVAGLLARALTPLQESIEVAFVFGSMAAGTERADSDVDLMVVGNAALREVSGALAQARAALGRELNVVTLTAAELRRRASERDHFVTTVPCDPKLFVKGAADDLERVARAGADSAPSDLGR